MSRTLLVGHPKGSWRDWLKANLGTRDLLILDPTDADHGPAARAVLLRDEKVVGWRLIGTIDPQRNPLGLISAGAILSRRTLRSAVILTHSVRLAPVLRQIALAIAEIIPPTEILVPAGSRLEHESWPVGAEVVELPEGYPPLVKDAQRRARWIELMAQSERHEINIHDVSIQGTRLGSGRRLLHQDFPDYAEVTGGVLHIVSDREPDHATVARAMDLAHATRMSLVSPSAYEGLVCSFAHQSGEEFGIGRIESLDPDRRLIVVQSDAVVPAPVRILRIGSLAIDLEGREIGDARPWTV